MKKHSLQSLLKNADEKTLREIAEHTPVPFDTDQMFQQSLAKWKSEDASPVTDHPVKKRMTFLILTTAACLLLTVGLVQGVWSRQQRIETRPLSETTTETRTTTSATTAAQAQHTAASTEASRITTSHSAAGVMETTLPATTAAQAQHTAVSTEASCITTSYSAAGVMETILPPTTDIPQLTEPTESIVTEIVTSVPDIETAEASFPETQSTTTIRPTETVATSISIASSESETPVASIPVASSGPEAVYDYEVLPGFCVKYLEELVQIYSLDVITPSPAEHCEYTLSFDRYSIASVEEESEHSWIYTIIDVQTGQQIQVQQRFRDEYFSSSYYGACQLTAQNVGGHSGFWIVSNQERLLIWDDGFYTFSMYASAEAPELFLEIAEFLHPGSPY